MRWIVRDIGVFLFGCIFISRYIFLGRTTRTSGKQNAKRKQFPVLAVQRRDLRIA
jgi:hypothetical protein